MDNIESKIARIMSDPEALKEVQELGKALGITTDNPEPVVQKNDNPLLSDDALKGIAKIAPLLSQVNREDDTTRLLAALRPFLSDEKCRKLDSAKKMIGIMKLLPVLKNEGILNIFSEV